MSDEKVTRTVVVDYDDDSERKRAEYQMDQKSDNFSAYQGLVRRFEGTEEEFDERYRTLAEKVGDENLYVETAEEIEHEDLAAQEETTYEIGVNSEAVETWMNYWFGSQAPGGQKTGEQSFALYSKKWGQAEVNYETESTDSVTEVKTNWEAGSQEALEGFKGLFEEELETFEESQR